MMCYYYKHKYVSYTIGDNLKPVGRRPVCCVFFCPRYCCEKLFIGFSYKSLRIDLIGCHVALHLSSDFGDSGEGKHALRVRYHRC